MRLPWPHGRPVSLGDDITTVSKSAEELGRVDTRALDPLPCFFRYSYCCRGAPAAQHLQLSTVSGVNFVLITMPISSVMVTRTLRLCCSSECI